MIHKAIKDVLLIEDNPGDARLLQEMLNDAGGAGARLIWVAFMREAETYLEAHHVDVILLDLGLPDAQGLDAVRRARAAAPCVPLVVLTGLDDETMATMALHQGAGDYLIKGEIETRGLMRALRYAIERQAMQEDVRAIRDRAIETLNCIGDAVACTDMAGNVTFLNLAAETMTGWFSADAAGRPVAEVFRILDGVTREAVLAQVGVNADWIGAVHLPADAVVVRRDGVETAVEDSIAPIHDRGGQPIGAVFVLRDATRTRAMTKEITHAAEHDFLTGLPNRILLNDRIGRAMAFAARHEAQIALVYLDLNGFKQINDKLGHAVGDKLLQSIANRLVVCVRGADTVSRQGGDEFIVLLSEMKDRDGAAVSAGRLLAAVAQPHFLEGHEINLTASLGISVYPDDGSDAETLIKNADAAMYLTKENGRLGYRFFSVAPSEADAKDDASDDTLRFG